VAVQHTFELKESVKDIAMGRRHACALFESGGVSCWESDHSRFLVVETMEKLVVPGDVKGIENNAIAIGAGPDRTCAVLKDMRVFCWGAVGTQLHGGTANETTFQLRGAADCSVQKEPKRDLQRKLPN
jgi:hypothetical protein